MAGFVPCDEKNLLVNHKSRKKTNQSDHKADACN